MQGLTDTAFDAGIESVYVSGPGGDCITPTPVRVPMILGLGFAVRVSGVGISFPRVQALQAWLLSFLFRGVEARAQSRSPSSSATISARDSCSRLVQTRSTRLEFQVKVGV